MPRLTNGVSHMALVFRVHHPINLPSVPLESGDPVVQVLRSHALLLDVKVHAFFCSLILVLHEQSNQIPSFL